MKNTFLVFYLLTKQKEKIQVFKISLILHDFILNGAIEKYNEVRMMNQGTQRPQLLPHTWFIITGWIIWIKTTSFTGDNHKEHSEIGMWALRMNITQNEDLLKGFLATFEACL